MVLIFVGLGTGKPFSFQISHTRYCPATPFYSLPPRLISLLLRLPLCTSLHTVEFKGHATIVLKRGSLGTRLVPKFTVLLLLCVGFCGLCNIPHSLQTSQYKLIPVLQHECCYAFILSNFPMLQIMLDYDVDISRLLFFVYNPS